MIVITKRSSLVLLLGILIFVFAFLYSSSLAEKFIHVAANKLFLNISSNIVRHFNVINIYSGAWHYFLLSREDVPIFYLHGLSWRMAFVAISNAMFNTFFQPIFLCVFTPQAIFNYILFPFFIYGSIIYFKKIPLAVILFVVFSIYIGMNDSIVEPLIRHRIACELIYLAIGVAGLTNLITKRL